MGSSGPLGAGTHTLIEHWDGKQWSPFLDTTPNTTLNGIAALTPDDIWAVGSSDQVPDLEALASACGNLC